MTAHAADVPKMSSVEAAFSADGTAVNISGVAENLSGSEVIVKIANEGYSDSDISTANKDALLFLDDRTVESDGKFSFSLKLANAVRDGRYYLYISNRDFECDKIELWYLNDVTRDELIRSILSKTSAAEVKKALFDDKITYTDGSEYNAVQRLALINASYSEDYDSFVSDVIFNDKPMDYENFKQCFAKATVMAAIYNGDYGAVADSNGDFVTAAWKDGESAYKAYDKYSELMSTKSKFDLLRSLNKERITKTDLFDKEFIKQTVYYCVYGAETKGYGHISAMLDKLLPLTGDDYAGYYALGAAAKSKLCSDLYLSAQSGYDGVKSYIQSSSQSTGGTTGGGSGSSSGGGGKSGGIGGGDVAVDIGYNSNGANEFYDLAGFEWAKDAITVLKGRGIINGVSATTFEPSRSINREEFIKMLVVSVNMPLGGNASFEDVTDGMWCVPYIGAAAANNLVNGIGGNRFGVGTQISRQDCAVFIYRALKDRLPKTGTKAAFGDSADIADYAADAVDCLAQCGIINGFDNNFLPNGNANRAEVAVMIYRLIEGGYIK